MAVINDHLIEEFVQKGPTWVWQPLLRDGKEIRLNRFDAELQKNTIMQQRGSAAIGTVRARKVE